MTFPSNVTTYSTYQEVENATSKPVFLKYYLEDNVVKEIFAGINWEEVFYLKGGDGGAACD